MHGTKGDLKMKLGDLTIEELKEIISDAIETNLIRLSGVDV